MSKSRKEKRKPKPKRKLTAAEKRAKRERRRKYMTIFINGKQKRVLRPQLIDGMPVDEFIARNADPIWLHQNELWEHMPLEGRPFDGPEGEDEFGEFIIPDEDSYRPSDPEDEFREFIIRDDESYRPSDPEDEFREFIIRDDESYRPPDFDEDCWAR